MRNFFVAIAMVAMVFCGVASADVTTGLIAHYTFENVDPNNSGNSDPSDPTAHASPPPGAPFVADVSGNGRDLAFISGDPGHNNVDAVADVSPTTGGPFGNVFHGQGTGGPSGYAWGQNVLPVIPPEITMATWFKSRQADFAGLGISPGNNGQGQEFFNIDGARMTIAIEPPASFPGDLTSRASSFVYDGTSWNPQAKEDDGAIVLGDETWHHIAATYSQASGDLKLYVDGSLRGTVNRGAGTAIAPDDDIHIGGEDDGRGAAGYIDEARMYERVLSAADIMELYNTDPTLIPEPATIAIAVVVGLGGLVGLRRRHRA